MEPAHRETVTEAEYLEREQRSEVKHEFVNGEMIAMAGATWNHTLIATNVAGFLRQALRDRPCFVLSNDLRVNVSATRLYTYPDVSVVCGKPEFHPSGQHIVRNPTTLFEVLSESTEAYDRGAKFAQYRKLPSLREYVLVFQTERRIEHYRRVEVGAWMLTEFTGDAVVPLPALEIELPLSEVYSKVEWPAENPPAEETK